MKTLNFKRILAILLTLCLTLSLLPVSAFAATGAKDIDGHWAASAIETCHTYGIMNGDGSGYYKPNDDITRAEFTAMVNRAFGYDALAVPELTGYTDVPAGKWYANDMRTAIALGIIEGYGNGIAAPEDKITREQAAVILYKVLRLNAPDAAATKFTDMGSVSSWAKDAVLAMEQSGYIAGYNNQFMPKKNITRGETAQLLLNVFGVIVDGNFDANGQTYKNVTIRKAGVTLKNAVITGDLFITEGVGDGDVWLDTVRIDGRLLATGGGENSIHVKDITVGDNVVADKPSVAGVEPLRFRAIQTNDSTVIFQGTAREVIVTEDIIIIIDMDGEKTVFNMFKPEDGAAKPAVVISENATVDKVTAFVPAEITGGGEVGKVEARTPGVEIGSDVNVKPENVEAEKGVEVKIGGETVTGEGIKDPTTKPSDLPNPTDPSPSPTTPPSSGGNGGSSGGTTTTNAKTPTISTQPQGAGVTIGTTHTLTVSASAADGGTLSYQWYSNTSASTSGGTAISGATSASYAAPINTAGTFYYYVVVTNTNNSVNGTKTASVTSNAVTLTVNLIPITSAAITVTAPAKGDTPNTTAGGTSNFSVGTVSWTPNDNPFQSGTQYTATVTLTADANYTFTGGLTTATINGYTANVTNNGVTAVLSCQFAATASKTVTGIAVKTQPTSLSYTHGDTLDLTELEVTLTYDDTTTEDVALTDFAAKNISANPVNGAVLARSIHDGQPITVSCGSQSANTNNLVVGKKSVTATLTVSDKVYDGNANATVSNITINGKVGSDEVTVSGGNAYFDNLNAGSGKTVTFSGYTLSGVDADNYSLSGQPTSVNANITAKPITLTVGMLSHALSPADLDPTFTVTASGLVGADTINLGMASGNGLNLSNNSGIDSMGKTVTIWYNGTTAVSTTSFTRALTISGNSNYTLSGSPTLEITIFDGQAVGRAIPLTSANIMEFNNRVNSNDYRTNLLKRYYILTEDIALTDAWKPIGYNMGNSSYPFTGSFNGDGFTISNLNITMGTHYKALFTEIGANGKVHNLKVTGSYSGAQFTAGIAGISSGTIQNCETNITLTATGSYSGGIAGQNHGAMQNCIAKGNFAGSASLTGGVVGLNSGVVENCSASGTISVTGSGGNVGGVVGYNNVAAATIKGCFFTGTLNSEHQYTGGIVGMNDGGTIENCFTTGSVTVNTNVDGVGGIVGNSRANGVIKNCYSTGDVTSQGSSVGGILGFTDTTTDATSTVTNCYSTGNISGNGSVGGIAGGIRYGSVVENCYASGEVTAASGGAAGIVAYHQDSAVNNCVALNPSVTAKAGVEYGMGRVSGTLGNTYMDATGNNNYAWSGMAVQYNTNTSATDKTLDEGVCTKDGADLSAAAAKTQAAWQSGGANFTFDDDNWKWTADYMPHLFVDDLHTWPAHLAPGSGTQTDPFKVYNAATLQKVGTGTDGWTLSAYYLQTADIDMDGQSFTSIGNFSGTYDGGGHTISDLTVCMFNQINATGTVKNLELDGAVTSTGSIAMYNFGLIDNCGFAGTVTGTGGIGGIVSINYNGGVIRNCRVTGHVTSTGTGSTVQNIGGIAGENAGATIENCFVSGNITIKGGRTTKIGGIMGQNYNSNELNATVRNCYFTGTISGGYYIGGISGTNSNSTIENCYVTGKVNGASSNGSCDYVGGIVGSIGGSNLSAGGTVKNCVALNQEVTATSATTAKSTYLGRIMGGTLGGDVILANNYAWNSMTVTNTYSGGTEPFTPTVDAADKDGADITSTDLWTTLGFTDSWWTGKLPDLSTYITTFVLPIDLSQLAAVTVTTSGSALLVVTGTEDGYTFVGETVTVTATPDEGWVFVEWQDEDGNTVSTDAEYSFTVTGDVTLIAVCVEDTPVEPLEMEEAPADEPRKEPDPVIVPEDNDEEDTGPDGDGGNDDEGGGDTDSGGDNPSGENTPDEDSGAQADYFETLDSVVKSGARGEITVQEAIATLNNLLAYSASVTRG